MVLNGEVISGGMTPAGGANTTFLTLTAGETFTLDVKNNYGWCWAQGNLYVVHAADILRATVGDSWPEYPVALTFRGPDGGIVGEVVESRGFLGHDDLNPSCPLMVSRIYTRGRRLF